MKSLLLAASALMLAVSPAIAQNFSLEPVFGEVHLSGGFQPDPYSIEFVSGGVIDASALGGECTGYVANAPDFRLHFTPGSLGLTIAASADNDVTIVINAPDGSWYCNDDMSMDDLDAAFTFSNPMAGQYDIWVGTYSQDDGGMTTLSISELDQMAIH